MLAACQIPVSEIQIHPSSFGDPNGQVFSWQGELFRGITAKQAEFYKKILNTNVINDLIRDGLLIDTEITNFNLQGYEVVLKHRRLPIISYPYEWCFTALKDAALLVLDVQERLEINGLSLHDSHPWNVVFDGCRPRYVDFGSITPAASLNNWIAYDEFCRFYLNPMLLMANGSDRIARLLLHDYNEGVHNDDVRALLPKSIPEMVKQRIKPLFGDDRLSRSLRFGMRGLKAFARKLRPVNGGSSIQVLREARNRIEALEPRPQKTEWSDYYDTFPNLLPSEDWNPKHQMIHDIILRNKPKSVLDVAGNRGWYSQLAAVLGSDVVSFDKDEVCVAGLYADAKAKKLRIHPVVMDLLNPSPGFGLHGRQLAPAVQRFKCEMVLALAIVHHLVFKARLKFDDIVRALSAFSTKWLVVEFISREDRYVSEWWTEDYGWYSVENFEQALGREFAKIQRFPSFPESRLLLVCER